MATSELPMAQMESKIFSRRRRRRRRRRLCFKKFTKQLGRVLVNRIFEKREKGAVFPAL